MKHTKLALAGTVWCIVLSLSTIKATPKISKYAEILKQHITKSSRLMRFRGMKENFLAINNIRFRTLAEAQYFRLP